MKVEKSVGWLKGQNGTGNIFELSSNGGYALGMIWPDGKFHYQDIGSVKSQVAKGTAFIEGERVAYLSESALPKNADGSLQVDNPSGWERLYTEGGIKVIVPDPEIDSTDSDDSEAMEFPFSIELSGKIKLTVGGLTKFLSLLS